MHQVVKRPIASFVSKMIVAMFWKLVADSDCSFSIQLPIQKYKSNRQPLPVADSKKKKKPLIVWLCFKNAGSHILETVADSDCNCWFSSRFKNTSSNRQPATSWRLPIRKKTRYYCLALFKNAGSHTLATVADSYCSCDSVADSKTQYRIGNRQLAAGCRFEKTVIIVSRVQ